MEENIKNAIENFRLYAEENGFSLNRNEKIVEALTSSLLQREEKFGNRYCPCRKITGIGDSDKKIICPCYYMKGEIEERGSCLCGLFVKK
jgi:ferredoxin-thioredoxin reductase catalytic chain